MRERSDWMGRLNLYDTSSSTVNHQLQLTGGAVANLLSGNNQSQLCEHPQCETVGVLWLWQDEFYADILVGVQYDNGGLNRWGGGKVLCSPMSRAGYWLGGLSERQ